MDSVQLSMEIKMLRTYAQLALNDRDSGIEAENQEQLMLLQRSIELVNRQKRLNELRQIKADPESIRRAKRALEEAFHARAHARAELRITQNIVDAIQAKANEAVAEYKNQRPTKRQAL
jgi:hypothetical protein